MSDRVRLIPGDCRRAMRLMAARGIQVDSIVTDPPYHLTSIVKRFGAKGAAPAKSNGATGVYGRAARGFMGKEWDGGDIAFDPETWALAWRVLKPGGHLLAFGGTRGWHRMACAIEDAGFEIRDTIAWLYGSGFPKGGSMAKRIDAHLGTEGETVPSGAPARRMRPGADQVGSGSWEKLTDRTYQPGEYVPATPEAAEWDGWGSALKPALEPVVVARKPLSESSVAANVLRHGTGAINVDGCKVPGAVEYMEFFETGAKHGYSGGLKGGAKAGTREGRWPANVVHDGSDEVVAAFAAFGEGKGAFAPVRGSEPSAKTGDVFGDFAGRSPGPFHGDSGGADRFFYSTKAGPEDRFGSKHPTVKPVSLIRWLARLVTPPGGLLLDPFAGSGTAGVAALAEGFRAVLIERDPDYQADIRERLAWAMGEGRHSLAAKARNLPPEKTGHENLPLFANGGGE